MTYKCQACSFEGAFFKGGLCPACGSHQIVRRGKTTATPPARKPFRLALALVLWLYLILEIYRNLQS